MSDRNWEAELAKIDKQLASVSDDQLLADRKAMTAGKAAPAAAPAARGAGPAPAVRSGGEAGAWRSWVKVALAVGAAAGLMFWPWSVRCGAPLLGFTAATGGVAALGIWSAIGTWRHRLGLAHVASLLVTAWGIALGAREVLPRVGYAVPTLERPGQWSCDGLPALPAPNGGNNATPNANPVTSPTNSPSTSPNGSPSTTPSATPATPPSGASGGNPNSTPNA